MAAAKGKGGLAVLIGPPEGELEDEPFDESLYEDDMAMGDEDESEGPTPGAFDAYADVVFNPEADPGSRSEALRQAIETVIEERQER